MIKNIPFIYKTGLKLKHKMWTKATKKKLLSYLDTHNFNALQLGAGVNSLKNWFNTDYFPRQDVSFLDVTKVFPVQSDSFDYVFSEHHIEHINYKDAQFMLKEVFRIMKKGGVMRICTPDLNRYMKTYFEEDAMNAPFVSEVLEKWIKSGFYNAKNYIPAPGQENISFFVNDIFLNYEHKFIYDAQTLIKLLKDTGFSEVYMSTATKSDIEALNNIETHVGNVASHTLAVEAIK